MLSDYKKTLNLPITRFSMRGNLTEYEPKILENWYNEMLYHIIRIKKNKRKMFFIHDGPPYANGNIHIGHAINKVLKDIVIKSKGLMGYNAHYIPGWDCHGLPIELKVEQLFSTLDRPLCKRDFRLMCREYALTQIEEQKNDFVRLGILGDWDNYYYTMDFSTEANIIRCLAKVISRGYLYRGIRPVYWCMKCCSVLSEAEIEYNSNHISPSIYLGFSSSNSSDLASKFGCSNFQGVIFLIVWNTTPWTLPGNRALAVHPDYDYCLAKINEGYYVFAISLLENILKCLNCSNYEIISFVKGKNLEFSLFRHPFMEFDVPVVLADYILSTVGTGVVHIAPGHGMDDYVLSQKYNLEVINLINSHGYYESDILLSLNNLKVFEANNVVISLLKKYGNLFCVEKLKHSYPYCWRHKSPIIFRTTFQWFINLDHCDLRKQCIDAVDKMFWIPMNGRSNMKSMLINRPDWCISRQRTWGVPIPIFLHKSGFMHIRTVELMEKIAQKVEKFGVQIWWDLDSEEMIGSDSNQYDKVFDVLDVWFDSGSSYFSSIACRTGFKNYIPDMYLEGSDQYRGWFMSSLVLSMIVSNQIPCKTVVSHGFSVDFRGKKMSKSLGNVVTPRQIVNKFGADILRLWIASNDYTTDIVFSDENIRSSSFAYRRIRNTVRFILGNLNDFNPNKDLVNPEDMIILDRWIISRALSIQSEIILHYENYNFHKVIQRIMYFCSIELGSFYLDIIKDRQYVLKKESVARRSSQSALYHIIEAMVRWIAPIISFTADEIWKYIPGERSLYVFVEEWYDGLFSMDSSCVMDEDYWTMFVQVRNEVNKIIEQERENGYIGASLEANIILYVHSELLELLSKLGNELRFGFLTSSVMVRDYHCACEKKRVYKQNVVNGLKIFLEKARGKKCLRCWHYTLDVGLDKCNPDICFRCITNMFGAGEERRFI